MLSADYIRHFKVLGKLAAAYDGAASGESAQNTLLARTIDQVANGESDSIPGLAVVVANFSAWRQAIQLGATALKALMITIAGQYLQSEDFRADLEHSTATPSDSAATIVGYLKDEMAAVGGDDKTLTTLDTVGMVNFFNQIAAASLAWNTEADSSADYKDSVYCVSTLV